MMDFQKKLLAATRTVGILKHFYEDAKQTVGSLELYQKNLKVGRFFTMELPWLNNQRNISRITPFVYAVIPHVSPSKGRCFKVFELDGSEVHGRSEILWHVGNYYTNTQGCTCPGSGNNLSDINSDGHIDVVQSKKAMDELFKIAPDGFILSIQ